MSASLSDLSWLTDTHSPLQVHYVSDLMCVTWWGYPLDLQMKPKPTLPLVSTWVWWVILSALSPTGLQTSQWLNGKYRSVCIPWLVDEWLLEDAGCHQIKSVTRRVTHQNLLGFALVASIFLLYPRRRETVKECNTNHKWKISAFKLQVVSYRWNQKCFTFFLWRGKIFVSRVNVDSLQRNLYI